MQKLTCVLVGMKMENESSTLSLRLISGEKLMCLLHKSI